LVLAAEQARAVRAAVASLPTRERTVLTLRFGLDDGGDGRTLEQVATLLGRTRQRVQQVEATALERLRRRLVALSDRETWS
jgi:RNA polymerase sigma factor (sigma-70 family)